jgi:hypothetical protein
MDPPNESAPDEAPISEEALTATKDELLKFLRIERPREIFYLGQLEVMFEERRFLRTPWGMRAPFHWITSKALSQLNAEGRIASDRDPLITPGLNPMRFFHAKAHRDWRRQAREMHALMEEMSRPEFNQGVGTIAEIMFDSALSEYFNVAGRETNEWQGRRWTATNENLDRIYVHRDGTAYGCEMKNTLPYIEQGEFERKVEMCSFLGVRPLIIARELPEIYIQRLARRGGFGLVYRNQLYPPGFQDLASRVRKRLELPVVCARAVPAGDITRFLNWHDTDRKKRGLKQESTE